MGKALLFSMIVLFFSTAHAEEHLFKFKMGGDRFVVRVEGLDYEQAFGVASKKCYIHYRGNKPFNEEYLIDVIDHCANPNSRMLGQDK